MKVDCGCAVVTGIVEFLGGGNGVNVVVGLVAGGAVVVTVDFLLRTKAIRANTVSNRTPPAISSLPSWLAESGSFGSIIPICARRTNSSSPMVFGATVGDGVGFITATGVAEAVADSVATGVVFVVVTGVAVALGAGFAVVPAPTATDFGAHVALPTLLGFRHNLFEQLRPAAQSADVEQAILQPETVLF